MKTNANSGSASRARVKNGGMPSAAANRSVTPTADEWLAQRQTWLNSPQEWQAAFQGEDGETQLAAQREHSMTAEEEAMACSRLRDEQITRRLSGSQGAIARQFRLKYGYELAATPADYEPIILAGDRLREEHKLRPDFGEILRAQWERDAELLTLARDLAIKAHEDGKARDFAAVLHEINVTHEQQARRIPGGFAPLQTQNHNVNESRTETAPVAVGAMLDLVDSVNVDMNMIEAQEQRALEGSPVVYAVIVNDEKKDLA